LSKTCIIIRLQTRLQAECWIHFTVRFGGVHAFGYNFIVTDRVAWSVGLSVGLSVTYRVLS